MKKKIELIWRGSVTDLATDIAYLLTPEQGERLARELDRFPSGKFQGMLECICMPPRGEGTFMIRNGCPVHDSSPR